jgi:hypothetical protein
VLMGRADSPTRHFHLGQTRHFHFGLTGTGRVMGGYVSGACSREVALDCLRTNDTDKCLEPAKCTGGVCALGDPSGCK